MSEYKPLRPGKGVARGLRLHRLVDPSLIGAARAGNRAAMVSAAGRAAAALERAGVALLSDEELEQP